MAYPVNAAITDSLILRDNANVAITGKVSGDFATVEAYDIATPATTAVVTLTEIGSGEYRVSFTPTTPATGDDLEWIAHLVYNSGGVFREFSETYQVTANTITPTTIVVVPTATSGALTQTLQQLRRRVADRFDDYIPLVATAAGNVGKTTLIDTANVNEGEQHYNGAQLLATSGTNSGLLRTVLATDKSTGTLTVAALTAQTAMSDTFDLYNRTGRRFRKAQYDRAINAAINDAFPMAVINIVADIVLPFDANVGEITLPASVVEVDDVEAQDSSGRWYTVPNARATGDGWFADSASGELRLYGFRGWAVNSLSLRVFGKGRQATLAAETDECVIAAEFIVARACYHLAMANVTNEDMAVRLNIFRDESERARVRIARLRPAINRKVRAA